MQFSNLASSLASFPRLPTPALMLINMINILLIRLFRGSLTDKNVISPDLFFKSVMELR